jgi:hypothetical protein
MNGSLLKKLLPNKMSLNSAIPLRFNFLILFLLHNLHPVPWLQREMQCQSLNLL